MSFFIIWICLGIVGAMISSNKGNSGCAGFLLGVLLGPIGLLITFFDSALYHDLPAVNRFLSSAAN